MSVRIKLPIMSYCIMNCKKNKLRNHIQSDLESAETQQSNLNLERLCGIEEHMQVTKQLCKCSLQIRFCLLLCILVVFTAWAFDL